MGAPITNEQLGLWESISGAATTGPWTKGRSFESVISPAGPDTADPRGDNAAYGGVLICESVFGAGDLAFIASARSAIPELLAIAKLARELTEALDGVLGTNSDEPGFEEKWDRAEVVCDRACGSCGGMRGATEVYRDGTLLGHHKECTCKRKR